MIYKETINGLLLKTMFYGNHMCVQGTHFEPWKIELFQALYRWFY